MLLLDGHCTHGKHLVEALQFAKKNNIHLLQLPGHTTHRLQSLDVTFFQPLQNYYVQTKNHGCVLNLELRSLSVYNVAALIREAYGRAATVGTAAGAFKGAGIWLVNRQDHDFEPSAVTKRRIFAAGNRENTYRESRA